MTGLVTMSSEYLEFADPVDTASDRTASPGWKLAIIDDDEAVHEGTAFALGISRCTAAAWS